MKMEDGIVVAYEELSKEELLQLKSELEAQFDEVKAKNLKLDMSRGKPSTEQLNLSMDMMDVLKSDSDLVCEEGVDCRNYGVLDGIAEAKQLLADMMEVPKDNIVIFGNSSLNVMYDTIARSMTHGVMGSTPWAKLDKVKFLCPVPGYDRHFAITEYFGIEMINVPMTPTGPDMDMVEELVSTDPAIKGIWCVPKYSNPQGITYSDETVHRFAKLNPAAEDFRIFWDNAYGIKQLRIQTIGHYKLNQLRHARYFGNIHGMVQHMKKHADILRPKFDIVLKTLDKELGGLGIGSWLAPRGGYFISFDSMDGCAKAIVAKAKEAGLIMTGAGATFPYGKDPKDSNIRIAPSYPTVEELKVATKIFVLSVKLVSIDILLHSK